VEQQQVKKRVKRNIMFYHPMKSSLSSTFNDPEWDKQWYMVSLIYFCFQTEFEDNVLFLISMMRMNTVEQ